MLEVVVEDVTEKVLFPVPPEAVMVSEANKPLVALSESVVALSEIAGFTVIVRG